jgi:hypothetical protein
VKVEEDENVEVEEWFAAERSTAEEKAAAFESVVGLSGF